MAELTGRQKLFVQEYLIDLNATQAAIRAGYSANSAYSESYKLTHIPHIRAAIDEAMAVLSKRTGINAERVLRELARVAFVNIEDVIDLNEGTVKSDAARDDKAAVAAVKVKKVQTDEGENTEREVRLADKLKALELLGKHLGMFTENINLNGEMGVRIIDDIPDDGC
jgi:phage terminase small subunit